MAKFLEEVEYIVIESHIEPFHDDPVPGMMRNVVRRSKEHGPYIRQRNADRKFELLKKEFRKMGYKVSKLGPGCLYWNVYRNRPPSDMFEEIDLTILEKKVSRKQVKS